MTILPCRPRGLIDRDSNDILIIEAMLVKIRNIYNLYGFEPIETPLIEYTESLGKFLPDQDRPNDGIFSFKDDDGKWLSLRYDLTAPLARYVAENFNSLLKPFRSYRMGWVFRNENHGVGRYRQFMQVDTDIVGANSVAADAEICMMAADCFNSLGINRSDYVIKINNRKILDGVLETIGLSDATQRLLVLRAIDKLDRLGIDGVRALLGEGRKDESGDFTNGARLDLRAIKTIITYISAKADNNLATLASLANIVAGSSIGEQGLQELNEIVDIIDTVVVDPSLVRGLEYYTGLIFEAELTVEIKDESGLVRRFGSIGGGGRYDKLIARFREDIVPATGFSIGISRLLDALQTINSPIVNLPESIGPVVVLTLDRDRYAMASTQKLVMSLRSAGIAAELYLGQGGMNTQLKYADKRRSRVAVIQGSNERNALGGPNVTIRDLKLGADIAKISKDRSDYLMLRQRAQLTVHQSELVEQVKNILNRK